jgi:hypothetical protein
MRQFASGCVVTAIFTTKFFFRRYSMSTVSNFLRRAIKPVIGLIVASAMIISCEAVNGPGADVASGVPGARFAALSAKDYPNAILITDQAGLASINDGLSATYVLGASFAVTGWTPICDPNDTGAFTGILVGAGYTITINSFASGAVSGNEYLGIFAASDGALFTNLTVDIATGAVGPVDNALYVGGLVAHATDTTFDGITVTGNLDISATTDEDFDVGLVAGYAESGSNFFDTRIMAGLTVDYDSTGTTSVNAGGIAGYITGSAVVDARVDGQFNVNADMTYDYNVGNSVALGGAAGYAANTDFDSVTVGRRTTVNAVTTQSPVYVGGVVGNGLTITIERNESAAVVSGDGPNYNTSGGGVAGYIVQSTVTDSSASGEITLNGTWDGSIYDVWQIYAGGLVGYSGGNAAGGSLIDNSHATGNVTATTPYPYAGGLVGYNYGYIVFTSAEARLDYYRGKTVGASITSNGSKITNSYATGNATAISTPESNGLPYAGGLAGYSSIPTADRSANIENCYATGDATVTTDSAYGWAGGLLGANAQGSVVSKCYASGDVSVTVGDQELPYEQDGTNPGAAGGGIAGVNYYTDASSGLDPIIKYSVAFNALIQGTVTTGDTPYLLHRVVGDLGTADFGQGTLLDNDGRRDMVITPVWNPEIGPDQLDGASLGKGADGYPALR